MTDELRERLEVIRKQGGRVQAELVKTHVLNAENIPGVPQEEQMLMKICSLVHACEGIIEASKELNNRLDSDLTDAQKVEYRKRTEQELSDLEKDKKEWN